MQLTSGRSNAIFASQYVDFIQSILKIGPLYCFFFFAGKGRKTLFSVNLCIHIHTETPFSQMGKCTEPKDGAHPPTLVVTFCPRSGPKWHSCSTFNAANDLNSKTRYHPRQESQLLPTFLFFCSPIFTHKKLRIIVVGRIMVNYSGFGK